MLKHVEISIYVIVAIVILIPIHKCQACYSDGDLIPWLDCVAG
jgi:hypothetical protein